jgi:sugar lactone lactonase YvrE
MEVVTTCPAPLTASQPDRTDEHTEVLFPEAKRRERHRRLIVLGLAIVVLGGTAIGYTASSRKVPPPTPIAARSPAAPATLPSLPHGASFVLPNEPRSLVVGPNGALYVADGNRILLRLPNGRFAVVAGTGEAGFSGDGGPAIDAELNDPGGMAFGPNGSLYVADSANGRVREIAPDGIIETVAGGGRVPRSEAEPGGLIPTGTEAVGARVVWPADVAFGSDHLLYIADSGEEIVRLQLNGTLTAIAGGPNARCTGICGIGGPAVDAGTDAPDSIAFDRAGDLYIAGFANKSLLMVTPRGTMKVISGSGFYPRSDGGLVTEPNGSVIGITGQNVVSISLTGMRVVYSFANHGFPFSHNAFMPNGIAVAPTGKIFLDTATGDGWTNLSVIAALGTNDKPDLVWKS